MRTLPGNRPAAAWWTAAALLAGCAAPAGSADCMRVADASGPAGTARVRAETVVDGLEVPWGIAFLPGGDLLVTERPGRVRLVHDGKLVAEPVARVDVSARSEGGLLGIALHPGFARNRTFFLYHTVGSEAGPVNRISRWELAGDARSARQTGILLDGIPAARYHDGGRLRIGPDGKLYAGTGDAGEPERAQDPASLAGKVLRLEPDGGVPADNPDEGSPVLVRGVRNVQAFDWKQGVLVVADHGPSGELGRRGHDEVSVAAPGANLGWPVIWGCRERDGMVSPLLTWRDAVPPGGAAFYTGSAIPEWTGSLLVGTLGSRHLHRVDLGSGRPARVVRHEVYLEGDPPRGLGRLREVAMGPDGQLYVTTSNCDGRGRCPPGGDRIVRIVPDPRAADGGGGRPAP